MIPGRRFRRSLKAELLCEKRQRISPACPDGEKVRRHHPGLASRYNNQETTIIIIK